MNYPAAGYGVSNKNVMPVKLVLAKAGNGHPSWIPSFEGMTNSKQVSGNLPGVIKER
jgi:hypothetical protein